MKFKIEMTSILPPIDGNLKQYAKEIEANSKEEALVKYREIIADIINGHSCQASIFDENGTLLERNCQL